MDKKKFYVAPSIEVLWLAAQTSILAASDLEGGFGEDATLEDFDEDW